MTTYYINLWTKPSRRHAVVHIGCRGAYVDKKRKETGNRHVKRAKRFEDLKEFYPCYSDFRRCQRSQCFGSSSM